MRYIIAIVLTVCLSYSSTAQQIESFVIKGTAKNHSQDFWELYVRGFIGTERVSVPIDKNNNFFKTIPINHTQDLILDLTDDGIQIFVVPGDTIEVNWDYKNFDKTFKLRSPIATRRSELDLLLELSRRMTFTEKQSDDLYDKAIPDSIKFKAVRDRFKSQVHLVLSYPQTENTGKIICDLYFQNVQLLNHARLLETYPLSIVGIVPKTIIDPMLLSLKTLNENLFLVSDTYRNFIFDKVRLSKPFGIWVNSDPKTAATTHPTLNDCFAGGAFLYMIPTILDWYLTKAIMYGFERYSFEGSEEAYQIFFPKIKTPLYRDTLERFFTNIQRLKPGREAPAFSLKDDKGKTVSLSDLKGKVVYIDFWSKYCAPCLRAIKEDIPQLHKKYKNKNVAFVNIALDATESEWKELLGKLKLGGINLWIGESSHPVCLAYNIDAVPHYILIDQNGKIVQPNADHPYHLLEDKKNIIDKLLE